MRMVSAIFFSLFEGLGFFCKKQTAPYTKQMPKPTKRSVCIVREYCFLYHVAFCNCELGVTAEFDTKFITSSK